MYENESPDMLHSNTIVSRLRLKIDSAYNEMINEFSNGSIIANQFTGFPKLFSQFASRSGKRIRPLLFTLAYFSIKQDFARYLFHTAASIELLHLFALIHDDVVDSSDNRRGELSLHKQLELSFKIDSGHGHNLAIILGDSLYSFAIASFLKVKEDEKRKQAALHAVLDAAVKTGGGQFLELLSAQRPLKMLSCENIYSIYDHKTSMYTFCAPLVSGALLAGMKRSIVNSLYKAGVLLGRAYQNQDDLNESIEALSKNKIPSDITENRKTILLWHLYQNSTNEIRDILDHKTDCMFSAADLYQMFERAGSFEFIRQEISLHLNTAFGELKKISSLHTLSAFLISIFKDTLTIS